jgi:hypothetical protein
MGSDVLFESEPGLLRLNTRFIRNALKTIVFGFRRDPGFSLKVSYRSGEAGRCRFVFGYQPLFLLTRHDARHYLNPAAFEQMHASRQNSQLTESTASLRSSKWTLPALAPPSGAARASHFGFDVIDLPVRLACLGRARVVSRIPKTSHPPHS